MGSHTHARTHARAQVLPFDLVDAPREKLRAMPAELAAEVATLTTYAKGPDGQSVEEWNYLDMFFVRYTWRCNKQ